MKKTTRDEDIAELEEARDKAKSKDGEVHRAAILEAVWEQMKDPILESLRTQLIRALRNNDFVKIEQIRKRVEAYASNPAFKKAQFKAMARISQKEAEIWAKKEGR